MFNRPPNQPVSEEEKKKKFLEELFGKQLQNAREEMKKAGKDIFFRQPKK